MESQTQALEVFRLKYWGKRDTWTWLVGFSALLSFVGAEDTLFHENLSGAQLQEGLTYLASGAVGVCFWLGLPFARLVWSCLWVVGNKLDLFS